MAWVQCAQLADINLFTHATYLRADLGSTIWPLRPQADYLHWHIGLHNHTLDIWPLHKEDIVKSPDTRKRIDELLQVVNLVEAAKQPLGGCSGGMKQHVEIAQALLNDPQLIITIIALTVGAFHFVKGENYQGPFPIFMNGYSIDILLPITLYLLLSLFQNKTIRSTLFRACTVFGFGCIMEASQYFGRPIFGSTFDPLDIVAYAFGVLLRVLLDLVLFPRVIPRWIE